MQGGALLPCSWQGTTVAGSTRHATTSAGPCRACAVDGQVDKVLRDTTLCCFQTYGCGTVELPAWCRPRALAAPALAAGIACAMHQQH